ncbi:amino acid ABC transporter permease [Candidatus Flexifilum breve]|uniref:amino acid ABC transporter permease n=1 Tax=Candidatus Flexifilum breve TaxID=3140694 RepID=UPI0031CC601F
MATTTDPRITQTVVLYQEPPIKPPPMLTAGPLAWLRNNLFSSVMNSVLTVLVGALIVAVIVSFINWVITQANWYAVIFNMRQFMLGRYQADAEWRVQLTMLLIAFTIGAALAAWGRITRFFALIIVVIVALAFVIPVAIRAVGVVPPTYLTAGSTELQSGSSTETPLPNVGFIAQAGETVSLRLATDLTTSDEALRTLHSFGDVAANLLRASAENRLTNIDRIAVINAQLAEDTPNFRTLTANQRAALETELGRLVVPEPIAETLALNQTPISYRVLRGTTFEPILEGELAPDGTAATVTLPDSGWYILETTGDGIGLLETHGIYPHLQRDFSRLEELDEAGNVINSAGRYQQYVRMTDGFITEEIRPQIEGRDVPMMIIIDNQYRGDRTFNDYLVLYLGPFLDLINEALLWIVIAGAVGYIALGLINRSAPASTKQRSSRAVAQRIAWWLLLALPVLMFVLTYGLNPILPLTDTRRWGGLLLTVMLSMVGIIASFPLGVLLALGRRSKLPVVSTACTLYIEFVRGVPLITVLFMAQLLVPLVNPQLAEVDNVFRAMVGITLFSAAYLAENVRGGLQAIPPGQEEAAKALGLAGWQVTLFVTLPQALRLVIPALVGQFISLFKDTSLVAIVGLVDLAGISQATVAQTEFLGLRREVYIFISIIYFAFCYIMAALSRRLEASGSGAARRV